MCLIIQAKKPQVITKNMMNCAYLNNDDGFGVMYANKGKIQVQKIGKPKSFKAITKVWNSYKDLNVPIGLHFRFNTNGESSKSMSHPFQILNKEENSRDVWVMHNGPQLPTPMIDNNKSDTHQFVKWVLKPQLVNEPELLYNPDWQEMLADMIGSDKLLFLDSKTEEFTIINEEQGKTTDDMWLSNTYSLQPTGSYAMNRDYEYDIDTDKLKKKSYYYDDSDWDYNGIYRGDNDNWSKNYVTNPNDKSLTTTRRDISIDGTELDENDFYGMTQQEILELVQDNPNGISQWINDLIYSKEVE
tara:strand:- start:3104 stop:4006 length:903 start_codon:yes stop_codon:yes gene_type:complete